MGPVLSKPGRRRIKCYKESNVPLICTGAEGTSVSSRSIYVPAAAEPDELEQTFDQDGAPDPALEQIFDEVFEEPLQEVQVITEPNVRTSEGANTTPSHAAVPPPPEIPPEHFRTHTPKHPNCPICNGVKMQFALRRAKKSPIIFAPLEAQDLADPNDAAPEKFGDQCIAD